MLSHLIPPFDVMSDLSRDRTPFKVPVNEFIAHAKLIFIGPPWPCIEQVGGRQFVINLLIRS